ncbi:hypothetical protein HMPREF3033_01836 [Veillonellaceae bacterium DNF00751]|nr:hypothetical protein HMPREF3033_01836 [Veillonellaceae bacterium DNF00751]
MPTCLLSAIAEKYGKTHRCLHIPTNAFTKNRMSTRMFSFYVYIYGQNPQALLRSLYCTLII